jgi:hypothetical protein
VGRQGCWGWHSVSQPLNVTEVVARDPAHAIQRRATTSTPSRDENGVPTGAWCPVPGARWAAGSPSCLPASGLRDTPDPAGGRANDARDAASESSLAFAGELASWCPYSGLGSCAQSAGWAE